MINESEIKFAAQGGTLSRAVQKAVEKLFIDLQGEKPRDLYDLVLAEVEKPMLEVVMHYSKGNQQRAAAWLGLNRNTLRVKLKKHGLHE